MAAMIYHALALPLLLLGLHVSYSHAKCYDPSPAFPLPIYSQDSPILKKAFTSIEKAIHKPNFLYQYPNSHFSIQITSSKETLWSSYHTAEERNQSHPGAPVVDGDTVFRIASITKSFTTLASLKQHAAGNLSLEDPVKKYIHELEEEPVGSLPWKDITLRALASQLSGLPREAAQSDLINGATDPSDLGLPPFSDHEKLPHCYEYANFSYPCTRKEILDTIKARQPLFAPNAKSTYSNNNFILLGLVLENVTGIPYVDHIKASVFDPLNMTSTSFEKPDDDRGAIPTGWNYWNVSQGITRPSGGIYSTASDLSKYLRYILTHYNGLTPALSWANPASWATGMNSFYGTPWEISRTSKILPYTKRPVTFVTKAGGLPGYYSIIIWIPDYDLGVTILVAGSHDVLEVLREEVTVRLVKAAEELAWLQVKERYEGTYVSSNSNLNTTLSLTATPSKGLHLTHFISNNTNMLSTTSSSSAFNTGNLPYPWHAQLIPTLLFRNETAQQGELWRMLIVPERSKPGGRSEQAVRSEQTRKKDQATHGHLGTSEAGHGEMGVWDDFCITDDDPAMYGGIPLNEFVFWSGDDGERVQKVELSAFRITLGRKQEGGEGGAVVVVDGDEDVVEDKERVEEEGVNVSRGRVNGGASVEQVMRTDSRLVVQE